MRCQQLGLGGGERPCISVTEHRSSFALASRSGGVVRAVARHDCRRAVAVDQHDRSRLQPGLRWSAAVRREDTQSRTRKAEANGAKAVGQAAHRELAAVRRSVLMV